MHEPDRPQGAASRAADTLDRIAAVLGCPVSALTGPHSGALAETDDLLRLWLMIEDEQKRAKVLAFARASALPEPPRLAAESRDSPSA